MSYFSRREKRGVEGVETEMKERNGGRGGGGGELFREV